jgi:hypothetical protein
MLLPAAAIAITPPRLDHSRMPAAALSRFASSPF